MPRFFTLLLLLSLLTPPSYAQLIADFCFCDVSDMPTSLMNNTAGENATAIAMDTRSDGEGLYNTSGEDFNVSVPAAVFEGIESIMLEFDFLNQENFSWLINAGDNRFRFGNKIDGPEDRQGLWVRYFVMDENGQLTEVDSGPIPNTKVERGERAKISFTYDHVNGIARIFKDNVLVWETPQEQRTPGQFFYLDAENGEVVVGSAMNGEASDIPSLYSFKAYDQSCGIINKPTVNNGERCGEGEIALIANGTTDGNYQWYDEDREAIAGASSSRFTTPFLSQSATFYVSITEGPCESELVAVEATIHPIPDAPEVTDVEKCGEGEFILTAAGSSNGNYRWYDADDNLIAGEVNASYTTPVHNASTTYYVSVSRNGCESEKKEVRAIVNPVPNPPLINDVARCGSGTFTLFANGASDGNYRWYDANGNRLEGEANATFTTPHLQQTTSFFVSSFNGTCESERVEVQAVIQPTPTAPTVNNVTRCEPGEFILQASDGDDNDYRWYDENQRRIADESNETFTTPFLNKTTTYYVAIFDGTCESEKVEIQAIIAPTPDAPTANNVVHCEAGEFVLQASGTSVGEYRWYDENQNLIEGESTDSFTTPLLDETTSYYVAIFNGGCESEKVEVQAVIHPTPTPPAVNNITRCEPGEFVLQASGGDDNDYRWYDENQNLIADENTDAFTTPFLNETTTYYVSIFDGTCESERVAIQAILNTPPPPPETYPVEHCGAGEFTLTADGTSDGNYRWYDANGSRLEGESSATYTTPPLQQTTSFFVSVFDGICESEKVEVQAVVHPVPDPPIADEISICQAGEVLLEPLTPGSPLFRWYTLPNAATYIHEGTADSFAPYIFSDTVYYVSTWNGKCESERIAFEVDMAEIPDFDAGEEVFIIPDERVSLQATTGFTHYQWYPKEGLSNDAIANPQASPAQTTTYQVTAETVEGCTVTDQVTVNVVDNFPVPNAFTPNNDGLNDTWEMPLIHKYPDCKVAVYNRWGEIIFYSEGYQEAWDGRQPNGERILGTYLYKIDLGNGKKARTGKLSVLK